MDMNILLVDDEADFVETMTKRFRIRKIPVATAGSGAEALRLVDEQDFDVVILDVRMPGMDGLEVLRQIRAKRPMTEVIMLTGHASLDAGMQGMSLGAYDYVLKPADFDDLLDKVRRAAERKALNVSAQARG
ncbi:Response regulator receiver domain-containing protein [Humidesulfovibrio mexicanus]|uniref:Response regulator receiver domain-containing protein n=1 Tax=Humidesulfovibrio mexicanus TaxID=147047 RepID=A0A238Z9K3_9BACT|nr:response regulator [Humidesulfovibrio mexicanus]SNR79980.1 Response regulator receiver domain-containing protein [Humidesulfovibrio mexicanus]